MGGGMEWWWPGTQEIIQELVTYLIEEHGPWVALAAYFLALIALSIVALVLVLVLASIYLPIKCVQKLIKWMRS